MEKSIDCILKKSKRFKTWKTWKRECELFWQHTALALTTSMTVNVSANVKSIKNIKMADSNNPIGKVRSRLCFYLCTLPCSSVSWLATLCFTSHFLEKWLRSRRLSPHKIFRCQYWTCLTCDLSAATRFRANYWDKLTLNTPQTSG